MYLESFTLPPAWEEKLRLDRIAPYNSGEMFASYVRNCGFAMGYDDGGG